MEDEPEPPTLCAVVPSALCTVIPSTPSAFRVLRADKNQNAQTPDYLMDFIRGEQVRKEFAKHFDSSADIEASIDKDTVVLDFAPVNHTIDVLQKDFSWWNHFTQLQFASKLESSKPHDAEEPMYIIYINPPYSQVDKFISKANEELAKVPDGQHMPILFLCPLRAETAGFHDLVLTNEKCFLISPINGSIKFKGYKSGLYGSLAFLFLGNGCSVSPDFRCIYTTPERETFNQKNLKKRKLEYPNAIIKVDSRKLKYPNAIIKADSNFSPSTIFM